MRALLLLLLLGAAPATGAPNRIVSLNLCADQYLIALANPRQIAALTRFSPDPQMSAAARRAAQLPQSRGSAEDLLALRPDLVLTAPGPQRETARAIAARGVATLNVDFADSYADIVAQTRQVAAAVGHPARGEALVRRMDAALANIPAHAGGGRVAAYYQRRGYLTGTGTLVDELLRRVGLVNLAAKLGKPALARVSLEEMALAQPDFLIVETATNRIVDQGTEMLHHPLLARIPRLRVPEAWTVCGGPAYVLAAASLARQLRRYPGRYRRSTWPTRSSGSK
jgi:iron complex transport system substrate-binding protein